MNGQEALVQTDAASVLSAVSAALPDVYGYLLRRCGSATEAEDLTSEVVLAAIDRIRSGALVEIGTAYLITMARNRLVDHWRAEGRRQRYLGLFAGSATDEVGEDSFEPGRAAVCLAALNPMQRAALTLRYLDDLTVPVVAGTLGRSVAATETLLMRAKRAFRDQYARTDPPIHD